MIKTEDLYPNIMKLVLRFQLYTQLAFDPILVLLSDPMCYAQELLQTSHGYPQVEELEVFRLSRNLLPWKSKQLYIYIKY